MKASARRLILGALRTPASAFFLRRAFRRDVFCLMLHRVGRRDPERLAPNEGMKVSPEFLDRFIRLLKGRGYRFLSMTQLLRALSGEEPWPSRAVVVTLDDGYRDNLTEGLPVFERHGVPFIVYLSTAFIGSGRVPWWYALEGLLLAKDEVTVEGERETFRAGDVESKGELFMRLRERVLQAEDIDARVADLCARNGYQPGQEAPLFLSWDEVRELRRHPLAELGNHGHEHRNLQNLSLEATREEFSRARELFVSQLGFVPEHYSYAYGFFKDGTEAVIRDLGARTCVTTAWGCPAPTGQNPLALPRFMLMEGMTEGDLLAQAAYLAARKLIK